MRRQTAGHARPQRSGSNTARQDFARLGQGARSAASNAPRLLALMVFLTAAFALAHGVWGTHQASDKVPTSTDGAAWVLTAVPTSCSTTSPSPSNATATPDVPLPIGIVAGHWGSDSGAVCDGWLREVDVNLDIAQRAVYTLRALGYQTDLLEEFDPRLEEYRARVLVSIHADSCLYPEASGFKVARVEDSAVPGVEDRLVDCLVSRYQARTGLVFHEGSITPDMTRYHTFYEIDPETPGAIIEVGFMLADRELLLHRQDLVAQGIVEGILCFVQGETP
ncbi:MAG TPA: N-acetylmuramoyl-L-alanine amidase [Chloroflexi bacterium]|nr:N-acetylmuramoyl-L-alanine amidase [Chloroflexota bacterium]